MEHPTTEYRELVSASLFIVNAQLISNSNPYFDTDNHRQRSVIGCFVRGKDKPMLYYNHTRSFRADLPPSPRPVKRR